MKICKCLQHFKKKLDVGFRVEPKTFNITKKKNKLSIKNTLEVNFATSIPDPIVYPPMSPTNKCEQKIRGLRPSDDYLVEIDGSSVDIRYDGKEFIKIVRLKEGTNQFKVKLIRKEEESNVVNVFIEKDTKPPTTYILANGSLVSDRTVTQDHFDIRFNANDNHDPNTTYFKVNNGITKVFSEPYILNDEGVFIIEFWSKDSLGNEECHHNLATFVIDRTPPTRPEIDLNHLPIRTNRFFVLVTGKKSEDAMCVKVNSIIANFINPTHWEATIPLTIEGINAIRAIAYDEAGNESIPVTAFVIRDTTPPAKPVLITNITKTKNLHIRIIGSQSQDTCSMLLNGHEGKVVLSSPVRWYADLTLEEGQNYCIVEALDDLGNISRPLIFTIIKDTTPPESPTVNPVISPTNQATQLLTGTHSPDTVKIVINNDSNIACVNPDGTWSALIELQHEHINNLEIQSEDDIGNRSPPTVIEILLDRTPPPTPTIYPLSFFTNNPQLILHGTKSADTNKVTVNGTSNEVFYPTTTTWEKTFQLLVGNNTFEVYGEDFLGNRSGSNNAFTMYKNTIPSFTIDHFPSKTLSSSMEITGTREAFSSIVTRYNIPSYPDGFGGTFWKTNLDLELGQNSFTFQAVDRANNKSDEQTIEIERLVPVVWKLFTIESIYEFGSNHRATVDGKYLPSIISKDIRSFFVFGKKPKTAKVMSNVGDVDMPDGIDGETWQFILPHDILKKTVVHFTLRGERAINPPEILISQILLVNNMFAGRISVNIGNNTGVVLKQNASIVITDYQYRNTPSPLSRIKLDKVLKAEQL